MPDPVAVPPFLTRPHPETRIRHSQARPWPTIPAFQLPNAAGVTPAGPVVVQYGHRLKHGYAHVEAKHGSKIAESYGGQRVEDFIDTVLRAFDLAYQQVDKSLWIIQSRTRLSRCAILRPVWGADEFHWTLITAYPLDRHPDPIKRKLVRLR